jgi:site-specific recombinase XerD
MRVTYNAYLRPKHSHDEHGTVYIRVTCERKHIYVNTFVYLERRFWNTKKGVVLPSCPDCESLNDLIAIELAKVRRNLIDFRLKGNEVNLSNLQKFYAIGLNSSELKDLVESYNRETNVSITRKRHMNTAVKHALSSGVPAAVCQIRFSHMNALKNFLSKNLKKNTMLSILKRLKSLFNYAVKNGILEKSPMDGLVLGDFESKTDFLTEMDLKKIEKVLPGLNKDLQPVAKMFVFCCYTGLRFGDAMNLKNCKVVDTDHGRAILFVTNKTQKKQYIPLLPEADKLLTEIKGLKYSNQYYNRCLKEIGSLSGVATKLSSHLARHTFATIGLNKGIKIDVMQSLLGHSDIKTTQGYAKLLDSTKWEELSKWNK